MLERRIVFTIAFIYLFIHSTFFAQIDEQKVALSALGENLLRNVEKKVDNAKITT
jgi:hypothetical protein